MNDKVGVRRILFGVFAYNWIIKLNPNEAFIIYCCTPYV